MAQNTINLLLGAAVSPSRRATFWFWVAVLVTLALAIFVVALTAMTRVAA